MGFITIIEYTVYSDAWQDADMLLPNGEVKSVCFVSQAYNDAEIAAGGSGDFDECDIILPRLSRSTIVEYLRNTYPGCTPVFGQVYHDDNHN